MEHFADSQSHVLAELRRIDILIQLHIRRAREMQKVDPQFQGLYLSDAEIDYLSQQPIGLPPWATDPLPSDAHECILRSLNDSSRLAAASESNGIELRLAHLARTFSLSQLDADILLIALAPEIDLRYEKFYAYLQDDISRKLPTVDLALNLLCRSMEEKLGARSSFGPQSPLLQHELIELREDSSSSVSPLLAKVVRVDAGIASYLTGGPIPDPRLATFAKLVDPTRKFEELFFRADFIDSLVNMDSTEGVLHFHGPAGAGKKSCAEALSRERGLRLMIANGLRLLAESDFDFRLKLLMRECKLHGAILFMEAFDSFLDEGRQARCETTLRAIKARTTLTILAGEEAWEPPSFLLGQEFAHVEFGVPPFETRLALWERLCQGSGINCETLANQFSFTGGQIVDAIAVANNLVRCRGNNATITLDDLRLACRSRSNRRLAKLATHIAPGCCWRDLVLPPERLRQLREVCDAVRHRARVFDSWGFGRKLYGQAINILFSGPSGTGKTMAAQAMSAELGLDLYKIDLSMVVSKYIGETEKNLSRIFSEARSSNAILFFDEADALFGKRTVVEDAHDRYANIETNYLLQKMEEHDGLAILATNLGKNMDESFTRRLHAIIEFPMPNPDERLRIWQEVWPENAPRDPGLDLSFMARRFELSGGNIRNIAVSAAFLAAADGGPVNMNHLLRATKLEYQKMRTVMANVEFAEYSKLSVAG